MMDRQDLDEFVITVGNFDLCPADLDEMGARQHFNDMLRGMHKAYDAKDEATYFRQRKSILSLLTQIASAKQRGNNA